MKRTRVISLVLVSCGLIALHTGCSSNAHTTTGTETNWLRQCESDADCGAYACYCGVCSASCSNDSDCENESVTGTCEQSSASAACEGDTPEHICRPESVQRQDAAVDTDDAASPSTTDAPETSIDSLPSPSVSSEKSFQYAAIPCAQRAPSQCYQGDDCYTVFATEVDGNQSVVGCTPSQDSNAPICALSPLGEPLLVYLDTLLAGWTSTSADACEPECFSPWRNADLAAEIDLPGCPCTAAASVCIEGVGMECVDATSDSRDDRSWRVTERPCDAEPDCSGGDRLSDCLARFETCAVGGVVLDHGGFTYCGDTPLDCSLRSEAGCTADCEPVYGVTNDERQAFGGCVHLGTAAACGDDAVELCVQRLAPATAIPVNNSQPVSIDGCEAPAGFALLDDADCDGTSTDCDERDESECNEPCSPYIGRKSPNGSGEFIACGSTQCSASLTICAADSSGNHVEFFGCLAPGWTEVNADLCND
jgi:hypothetical protein